MARVTAGPQVVTAVGHVGAAYENRLAQYEKTTLHKRETHYDGGDL